MNKRATYLAAPVTTDIDRCCCPQSENDSRIIIWIAFYSPIYYEPKLMSHCVASNFLSDKPIHQPNHFRYYSYPSLECRPFESKVMGNSYEVQS